MCPIVDGMAVNASNTNAQLLDAVSDDTALGKITLANVVADSGSQVDNIQKELNSEASFTGKSLNSVKNDLPSWTNNDVGLSTDPLKARSDALTAKFNSTLGHKHTGAAGDAPKISVNDLAGLSLKGDLLTHDGTVPAVLPVGTNNYVLTADSTSADGIAWKVASAGTVKATLNDPVSTILPTGVSAVIDGVTLINGYTVLFSNLSSGNNKIYSVTGVGVALVWTVELLFSGLSTPTDGDQVRIAQGTSFADQLSVFDGTNFKINDIVRYFSGTDYWEQTSLKTSTLANNTTDNVFTFNFLGSENTIVNYSLLRGTSKEVGQIFIVTDGVSVNVSTQNDYIGVSGTTFSGDIVGPLLRLRFTTDNSGSSATMKYFISRWSDAAGGPAGPPSYSVSSPSTAAAGASGQIQYNAAGLLAADADYTWDSVNNIQTIGGLQITGLSTATLLDNTTTSTIIYDKLLYPFVIIEYSIVRNTDYQIGRFMVVNNGTLVSLTNDETGTGILGASFTASIVGANVNINYSLTNTGFNGTFKYSIRRWV